MKHSEVILSILFMIFLIVLFFSRKNSLEKNKMISVGVITSYTPYKEVSYKFKTDDELREKSINRILSINCSVGDKFLVLYDSENPHTSFLLLEYPLPSSFKLDDNLENYINKDTINVSVFSY